MKLTTVFILLLLYLFATVPGLKGTCIPLPKAPACGCILPSGKTIDLRGLGNSSGIPTFTYKGKYNTYSYNPCYPFSTPNGCIDAAVCQLSGYAGEDVSIGIQKVVNFEVVSGNVVISYIGGTSGRTSQVTLKCTIGAPAFVFDEEKPQYNYRFTLSSQCGCPGACDKGVNGHSNGDGHHGVL